MLCQHGGDARRQRRLRRLLSRLARRVPVVAQRRRQHRFGELFRLRHRFAAGRSGLRPLRAARAHAARCIPDRPRTRAVIFRALPRRPVFYLRHRHRFGPRRAQFRRPQRADLFLVRAQARHRHRHRFHGPGLGRARHGAGDANARQLHRLALDLCRHRRAAAARLSACQRILSTPHTGGGRSVPRRRHRAV